MDRALDIQSPPIYGEAPRLIIVSAGVFFMFLNNQKSRQARPEGGDVGGEGIDGFGFVEHVAGGLVILLAEAFDGVGTL